MIMLIVSVDSEGCEGRYRQSADDICGSHICQGNFNALAIRAHAYQVQAREALMRASLPRQLTKQDPAKEKLDVS